MIQLRASSNRPTRPSTLRNLWGGLEAGLEKYTIHIDAAHDVGVGGR